MLAVAAQLVFVIAVAGGGPLATKPPLGFNTWNHFGCSGISADVLVGTAERFVALGLDKLGYEYINSDDCWMQANRSDGGSGPQIPNPTKFPGGMAAVAASIHNLGLKLGLYTARANHTCGGFAASCRHERTDIAQWAAWGVDYMKDDSCGGCRTLPSGEADVIGDYSAMQQAIWSVGRAITLTIEGGPDITKVYTGCCGNARRVGHDISARWNSMTSLVDVGAGLWPYAHNGSKSLNTSNPGGFWNDLDMIEVGNGDFVADETELYAAQARSHYSMWAVMKAVMLLGCDLTNLGNKTLSILKEPAVIAISQDSLGVQARRISSTVPKNTSLLTDKSHAVGLLSRCDPTNRLQTWKYKPPAADPPLDQLWMAPCNVSDSAQQLGFVQGELHSKLTGKCLDKAVSTSGQAAKFSTCVHPPPIGEAGRLDLKSGHILIGGKYCLDVQKYTGPAVAFASCKLPGANDANQIFTHDSRFPGMLHAGVSNSKHTGDGEFCLTVRPVVKGGLLFTTTTTGEMWCLALQYGPQGEYSAVPCEPNSTYGLDTAITLTEEKPAAENKPTEVRVLSGHMGYHNQEDALSNTGRNQFGSSGPLPHTRWSSNGGGAFFFDKTAASGSALRSTNTQTIIDDDNVGHVTNGGDFCLELSSGSALEVWAGPLSGGRWVVAMLNRSPATDEITVDFTKLPGLGLDHHHGATASTSIADHVGHGGDAVSFDTYEVWSKDRRSGVQGSLSIAVGAHDVALVILCPSAGKGLCGM